MVLVSGFRPGDAEDGDGFIFDVMRARPVGDQTEKIWRQRGRHIVTSVDGRTLRYGASVGAISVVMALTLAPYRYNPYLCTDRGQYILGTCACVCSNLARVLRDED